MLVAGLTFAFASSASASPLPDGSGASTPTIWSGQADYDAGSTVTLWGAGWQPGEAVHVHVNDDQGQTWSYDADITADDSGDMTVSFTLPDAFIATYGVTATGATSGTATTTFTDGNVGLHLTSPETASSMTVPFTRFSDTDCSAGASVGTPVTVPNSSGAVNVGPSGASSIQVGTPTAAGFTFTGWTTGTNSKDSGTPTANNPCITVTGGSGQDIYAHFTSSNHTPTIASNTGTVNVNEGSTASNTGTWSDADSGDTVSLTASIGTVTRSSGTWSWSLPTTDGPAQSQSVTITATDNHGASSFTTFQLNVANVDPTGTLTNGGPITEGGSATVSFASAADASPVDAASLHYAFSCTGADLSGTTYSGASTTNSAGCTFPDNGSYTVTGVIVDKDGGRRTDSTVVQVSNASPSVTAPSDQTANEGAATTFTLGSFTDPGPDSPWAVEVNWGDGSSHTTFNVTTTGSLGTRSHTYDDNGSYTVTVKVTDKDGGSGTSTFAMTVANIAPTATFANDGPVGEGSSFHLSLTGASDVSSADTTAGFTYAFDCGDGTGYSAFGASSTASCATTDDGTRSVAAKIRDKDGGTTAYTDTVTVRNVAPTATFSNDGPVDEGSSFHLALTSPSDASSADTTAGFTYAFDCGDGSGYSAFAADATATCPTSDNGTRDVGAEIRDKDGGTTEYTDTVALTNVAPTATFSNTGPVDEGSSFQLSLDGAFDPSSVDTAAGFTYSFDCGDNSGYGPFSSSATASCPTNDNDTRDVAARIRDKDGGTTEYTDTVAVHNVAPTGHLSNNGPVDEGSAATIAFTSPSDASSVDAASLHFAFSCDGADLSGTTYAAASATNSASCTFPDNGTYAVTGVVIDKDGGATTDSTTVQVNNVPPAVTAAPDQSGDEGTATAFDLGSFSDPGADSPWNVTVNWGDGSGDTTFNTSAKGSLGTRSHTYADGPASESVTVTVTDKDGASDSRTFTVTVNNLPPIGSLGDNGPVDEGSAATIAFTNPSDPSPVDAAGLHYAFSCSNGDLSAVTYAAASATNSSSCTFADQGTYTVSGVIIDKDGGRRADTTSVHVNNVAPTVTAPGAQTSNEGSSASFSLGSFGDPGPDSPWAVDVNWGDGSAHEMFDAASPGSLDARSHNYDDNGSYTVTVTVTDKDGASGSKTFTVTVANVAPSATFGNDGPVSEGTSFHLSLSDPSDPSGADTAAGFTYAFNCGSGYGSFASAAGATCPTTDNGTRNVAAKIRDKDGGITEYTATVSVTNVAPTITGFTGTGSFVGPLTTMPSTFTTVFTDPGTADTWTSLFTWNDGTAAQTVNPFTTGQTQTHIFATAGCSKTVTVKVSDDDGGFDTKSTTVSVGTASFMAPMTNQPVTNKLKNGQVLPVKVQILDCNGQPVTGLSPAIRLVAGDQTTVTDDSVTPITPDSVSSADTTGVMRYSDGAYMYNLSVNLPKLNTDYTVVIYPYGIGVTPQTLRHVIQATK
ncbi:MAG TPA: PKD domain-containing protein [Gaiellales bacterium]|jgi:uncharacterized repeat protein (TIGR02543 family)|nr:PKD domain-containing protein [Gaiellales bacterium]